MKRAAGFTLLEIVVSLAVVGLVLGVVISRMDTMLDLEMKSASNKLAATMRYLYNKAATEGLYIRLVLDIENNAYWVEATTDPFVISAGEELEAGDDREDEEKGEAEEGAEEEAMEEFEEGEGGEEGVYRIKPSKPVFTQVESYLLKPTKLPGSVQFKDVYVEHSRTGVSGGQESVYFFPNGYVEYAIVNLKDEDDEVNYSLETNPISGRVNIEPVYRRPEGM